MSQNSFWAHQGYKGGVATEEKQEKAKDSFIRGFVTGQKKVGVSEDEAFKKVNRLYKNIESKYMNPKIKIRQ